MTSSYIHRGPLNKPKTPEDANKSTTIIFPSGVLLDAAQYESAFTEYCNVACKRKLKLLEFPEELLLMIVELFLTRRPLAIQFKMTHTAADKRISGGYIDATIMRVCKRLLHLGRTALYRSHQFEFDDILGLFHFWKYRSTLTSISTSFADIRKLRIGYRGDTSKLRWTEVLRTFEGLDHLWLPLEAAPIYNSTKIGSAAKFFADICESLILNKCGRLLHDHPDISAQDLVQGVVSVFSFEGRGYMYLSRNSPRRTNPKYRGSYHWGCQDWAIFKDRFVFHVVDKIKTGYQDIHLSREELQHCQPVIHIHYASPIDMLADRVGANGQMVFKATTAKHVFPRDPKPQQGVVVNPHNISLLPRHRLKVMPAYPVRSSYDPIRDGFPINIQPNDKKVQQSPFTTLNQCKRILLAQAKLFSSPNPAAPRRPIDARATSAYHGIFSIEAPMENFSSSHAHYWLSFSTPRPRRTKSYIEAGAKLMHTYLEIRYKSAALGHYQILTFDDPRWASGFVDGCGTGCCILLDFGPTQCSHPACWFLTMLSYLEKLGAVSMVHPRRTYDFPGCD